MRSKADPVFLDLSAELNDELDWKAGTLRTFDHHLNITVWAYEPLSHLLAIGTSDGIVELYGGPGVVCRLHVADQTYVTNLRFASSTAKLVATDKRDRLHLWDLTYPRNPRLENILNFRHSINCMTLSSSHTHAFVGLANGTIQTYDLLCSRLSPYTIPNMWAKHEERVLAGGLQPSNPGSQVLIDAVIHHRDLNLLFIGYAGGVTLLDLTQQKSLKTYEYFLPPGAPGGAGYSDPDLLTERKPEMTALAVHPSGHLLATGHADGSIAFWAVEDEDKPLLAVTLDNKHDVNVANAEDMDAALSGKNPSSDEGREPIFKLAWSGFDNSNDPRGGDTVLTVLGGQGSKESPGVTALLIPPFNPPEPPVQAVPGRTLDPSFRKAMRQTVIPKDSHAYNTVGTPQDFLLLPRAQPHFSGGWDPASILLLSDSDKETRAVEAYQFPPTRFVPRTPAEKTSSTSPKEDAEEALADEIASTLESMRIDDEPQSLDLPPALWGGPSGVTGGALVSLDRESYGVLVADIRDNGADGIDLLGGRAWIEDDEGQMKLMQFQPHRVLATYHTDLTIRFRDLSAQLLVSSDTAPLQAHFPNPLSDLIVDLLTVLAEPSIASQISSTLLAKANISSTYLAPQSLECAVVLQSGEIAVFRFGSSGQEHADAKHLEDKELISTAHIPVPEKRKYHPAFLMVTGRGSATAFALADIGFLAAAYQDGSLFIVDMRGPKIILRVRPEDPASKRRSLLHRHEVDPIKDLTWTVAGTDANPTSRILLLALGTSGTTRVYSVLRAADGSWSVSDHTETAESASHPLTDASFVISTKNGKRCRADRGGLGAALSADPEEDAVKGRCLWVSAGAKGAKCTVDITGDRLGRVDWPTKSGKVEKVALVRKNDSTVLVAHTDKREAHVYSVPFLEHMHSLKLTQSSNEPLSVDETGDYIEWCRHPSGLIVAEKYGTLFNVRRSGPYAAPEVDLMYGRKTLAAQPQPVSLGPPSMLNSFWGYISSNHMTADQVDALLAGPDRPVPKPKLQRPSPQRSATSDSSNNPGNSAGSHVQNIANAASRGTGDLYGRLNNALAERGELLGNLEESFAALESGSKNMLSQAKSLAAKQTAKSWFQFS